MMKKFAATLVLLMWTPFAFAQDLNYGENGFLAEFEIDAAHTTDGVNYQISASGEAGPTAECGCLMNSPISKIMARAANSPVLPGRKMVSNSLPQPCRGFTDVKGLFFRCIL